MMFAKNVLLGSLSFASVLMVGNWSGAIAQVSNRYLSDQEIQSLDAEFQSRSRGVTGRGYTDRRQSSEIIQINEFVNAWQQVDSSISPFLGNWEGLEEGLSIYPSTLKGKVCVVHSSYGTDGVQRFFNSGTISGNKLISDGEIGKTVILTKVAPVRSGENSPFLASFQSFRGRDIVSAYVFPRILREIRDRRFTDLGCTASLPSKIQPQTSSQKHPAESVVAEFYTWYFQNNNTNYRRLLSQKRESFTPELYRNLDRAIRISETPRWSGMLNFDVFSNAQVESYSFQIDSVEPKENSAEVYVTLQTGLGYNRRRPNPIKVLVAKNNNRWQIADFVYLRESPNIYSLMSILRNINQKAEFSEIPWRNYEAIPSVPPYSTPVKPTDTIAKYPTNEDFNAFEDKLQGNPESLVKLRGNQAEQRRKFQNDWKARNPNAAKFLGAWYTGSRYFYVFPSTAKSRTCVVTQDANGKLDMQVGTVLNQEMRYSGGKGFFWRDRDNIVASRDSGSGSLYPIYATSGMPELTESMIGDMERQKCITTLPFEADAQYYKERGDKFVKLGKKDEAISNYRKALELLRKQNQFAQAKAIEAQIVKLGGSIK